MTGGVFDLGPSMCAWNSAKITYASIKFLIAYKKRRSNPYRSYAKGYSFFPILLSGTIKARYQKNTTAATQ